MRSRAVLALLLLMAMPTYALAQSPLPKEGSYDFTSCWSGVSNPIVVLEDPLGVHRGSDRVRGFRLEFGPGGRPPMG